MTALQQRIRLEAVQRRLGELQGRAPRSLDDITQDWQRRHTQEAEHSSSRSPAPVEP